MNLRYALTAAALLLAAIRLPAQQLHRFPVAGAITDSSAVVAVWLDAPGSVALEYGRDSLLHSVAGRTGLRQARAGDDNVVKFHLAPLAHSSRYHYRVIDSAGQPVSRTFSFRTFPKAGADAPFSVLFGSCQQEHPASPGRSFGVAARLGGDLFIQLGDWSYPDTRVPDYPNSDSSVAGAYAIRLDTAYPFARDVLAQMGVAYAWDDHDYISDNCDGSASPEIKRRLLDAYKRYLPHYPLANPASGIWHSFRVGNAEFFMIDNRSQRSPVADAFHGLRFDPPPGHSMLAGYPVSGPDQRRWLLESIRRSSARWKVLVSPVFFNPAARIGIDVALDVGQSHVAMEFADKWAGYPADVDSMLRLFQEGYGRNFLIISGDAHTNLYDDGTNSRVPEFMVGNLEIENSGLYTLLNRAGLQVWTDGQSGGESTVGRIRVETWPAHKLIVESFDESGALLFSYELPDYSPPPVARHSDELPRAYEPLAIPIPDVPEREGR